MTEPKTTKTCSRCKQEKSIESFSVDKHNPDGTAEEHRKIAEYVRRAQESYAPEETRTEED